MSAGPRRSLVVTADDFGLSQEVNEAVEIAHRTGILTAASLMVGEPALDDAVARARTLPNLAVGLHLTFVEGRAVSSPASIPDLIGPDGKLRTDLARYGAEIFFRPKVKRQIATEMRAQFEAYARTGLPLDHVNAHKHYHLHPTIAGLLLRIGPEYGMRSLRVPVEPLETLQRIEPTRRGFEARIAGPYARLLRERTRAAGVTVPHNVFGLAWSGSMTRDRVAGLLSNLPPGRTEIYLHPATASTFEGAAAGYRYEGELAALTDRTVLAATRSLCATSYSGWAVEGN